MAKGTQGKGAQAKAAKNAAAAAAAAAKGKKGGAWSPLALGTGGAAVAALLAVLATFAGPGGEQARKLGSETAPQTCKNKHDHDQCESFAAAGNCKTAPGWMSVFCAESCGACELRDPKVRCDAQRIGYDNPDAWGPGAVDELFATLPERYPQYNVTFLSRPPEGPWVAKFHNFVSDEEADRLIDMAGGNLRRSTDQGGFNEDGVQEQVKSTSRTSENAWCMGKCESDPLVMGVSKRISDVTGVPEDNFESFQLLRYDFSQEYRRHHDSSARDNEMLAGPRILTFFLYLSDVEEGGGTQFTDLKPPLTNEPERGTAILWPSVLSEDPTKLDLRTHHAALPVKKGVKFAANSWIHLRNYKTPNLWGCTGAFTID